MTAPAESIADLKARTSLVDVIRRYTALKQRRRGEWWGCCPFHGDRTPSFKVDAARGFYHCFGCGAHGDVIDFVARIEGLDTAAAMRRLRELVGDPDPTRPVRPIRVTEPVDEPDPDAERRRERAQEVWRESENVRENDEATRYLVEARGIDERDPDRLRFHEACPWFDEPTGRLLHVPAIVACVNDWRSGLVVGIWRIRLDTAAGGGKVERKGLGPTKHNASRLFWAPGPKLILCEGVEDALAAHALTGLPAWAALSAGNLALLRLPERFTEILVLADRDANGVGQESAHKLATRLRAESRHAEVRRPIGVKDPNDVLKAGRAA